MPYYQPRTNNHEPLVPFAEELTFRTDQIRARRDNAKYLALIASITLLHQYQRQQVTRLIDGTQQACVIATLDDLEVANPEWFVVVGSWLVENQESRFRFKARYRMDSGPCDLGTDRAAKLHQLPTTNYQPFRGDRTLRRHLTRLVELEYVAVYRTGCGNQRAYQLLDEHATDTDAAAPLGLIDVRQLRDPSIPPQG